MRAALLYLAPPARRPRGASAWTFAGGHAADPPPRGVRRASSRPLERLAGEFGDRDLVLVEPGYSSDTHVLATPLAYIYARHVLLFSSPRPGPGRIRTVPRVGGRALRSRVPDRRGRARTSRRRRSASRRCATSASRFPEYESARNAYPREVRQKKFNLNIYQLQPVDQRRSRARPRHRRLRRPVGAAHVRAPGTGWRHVPVGAGPLVRHR